MNFQGQLSRLTRLAQYVRNLPAEIAIQRLKRSLPGDMRGEKSITDAYAGCYEGYKAVCLLAAEHEHIFKVFKRCREYQKILEHTSRSQGQDYLRVIKANGADLVKDMRRFQRNDAIGSPVTYRYDVGRFSPTTLRYIKVLMDLRRIFGDLHGLDIAEIGGGYGGQCTIISGSAAIRSYTIIDLEAILPLVRKYLARMNVTHTVYATQRDTRGGRKYDLVISNYAFSECRKKVQQEYLENVLYPATRGYVTYNYDGETDECSAYSRSEMCELLSRKHALRVFDERAKTGPEDYIITWDDTAPSRILPTGDEP